MDIPPLDEAAFSARLSQILETHAAKHSSWFTLPGGAKLFDAGEPADSLYILKSGRLGVYKYFDVEGHRYVGLIRPGEPVGEMSMIAGTPHTSTVVALRDSHIMAVPRAAFLDAISKAPGIMAELARLMILRARAQDMPISDPSVFAFLSVSAEPIRILVEHLADELRSAGHKVRVLASDAYPSANAWFEKIEDEFDYIFYVAEKGETGWANLAARQVDHVFIIARLTDKPPADFGVEPHTHSPQQGFDLILTRAAGTPITGSLAWIKQSAPNRWFHVEDDAQSDWARLARILSGRSVGLVLSGGGARAFAHIGAIQALRESKTPIDFVGGASMGSIIAACVAMGWTQDELDDHVRKAFVESSPLDDIAFPMLAMTGGKKVDERLAAHFGNVQIEDLPLPLFCVSSNLTTGTYLSHTTGSLVRALRASISLPGVMPPVVQDDAVLVDGAVMKSFPTDLMRRCHLGTVVGIDVTRAKGLDPNSVTPPDSLAKWFFSGDWRRGPPIVSILMRSATITTASDLAESRRGADLLIIPKPEGVEIRDWRAYDLAVEVGYKTTVEALRQLNCPVSALRKTRQSWHPDEPVVTLDDERPQKVWEKEKASRHRPGGQKFLKSAAEKP